VEGDKQVIDHEYSDAEIRSELEKIIKDIAKAMRPLAASKIGISENELSKTLSVSLGINDEINAYADKRGRYIVINGSLMVFYHKMLKVFCATLSVGDKNTGIMYKPTIHPEKIASIMENLLKADLEKKLIKTEGLYGTQLNVLQLQIENQLRHCCECFAVGHELGHIIITRRKSDVPEMKTAEIMVEEFLKPINGLKESDKSDLLKEWTEEICADLLGLQLILSIPEIEPYKRWANYKSLLCSGAEISRTLDLMRQEYADKLNNGNMITLVSSHPHDYLRLKAIRSSPEYALSNAPPSYGKKFYEFSKIVDYILK
jgi:hypothetical protein